LFGNILGEEIVIAILFILAPIFVPVPMMLFAIFYRSHSGLYFYHFNHCLLKRCS